MAFDPRGDLESWVGEVGSVPQAAFLCTCGTTRHVASLCVHHCPLAERDRAAEPPRNHAGGQTGRRVSTPPARRPSPADTTQRCPAGSHAARVPSRPGGGGPGRGHAMAPRCLWRPARPSLWFLVSFSAVLSPVSFPREDLGNTPMPLGSPVQDAVFSPVSLVAGPSVRAAEQSRGISVHCPPLCVRQRLWELGLGQTKALSPRWPLASGLDFLRFPGSSRLVSRGQPRQLIVAPQGENNIHSLMPHNPC